MNTEQDRDTGVQDALITTGNCYVAESVNTVRLEQKISPESLKLVVGVFCVAHFILTPTNMPFVSVNVLES